MRDTEVFRENHDDYNRSAVQKSFKPTYNRFNLLPYPIFSTHSIHSHVCALHSAVNLPHRGLSSPATPLMFWPLI